MTKKAPAAAIFDIPNLPKNGGRARSIYIISQDFLNFHKSTAKKFIYVDSKLQKVRFEVHKSSRIFRLFTVFYTSMEYQTR